MIDEQSPASGHDYASNRWAIGAGTPALVSHAADLNQLNMTVSIPIQAFREFLVSPYLISNLNVHKMLR